MSIIMIALVDDNNAIATDNGQPIFLERDMQAFHRITKNETVIYGRETFKAFHCNALPARHNIMLSRTADSEQYSNVHVSRSIYDACGYLHELTEGCKPSIYIIGGESVYKRFIDIAKYVILTRVHTTFENPTKFFPDISSVFKMNTFAYDDIDITTKKTVQCDVEFYSLHSYNPLDEWGKFNGPLNEHTSDIRRARLIWMSTVLDSIISTIK